MFEQEVNGYRDCMKEAALAANRTIFDGVGFNKFNGAIFNGAEVFQAIQSSFECAKKKFPESVVKTNYKIRVHPVDLPSRTKRIFEEL